MTPTAENLAKKVLTLASLPSVYLRIVELADSADSSTHDFVTVISEDISLSARLMKLVNSAFFGYPSKVDTLSRAVTIIGIKQLQDLALATSVFDMFKNIDNELVSMEAFWRHSIACGVIARILANYRREFNVERAFVSGLLHDIGRLAMFMLIPNEMKSVFDAAQAQNRLLYQAERQVLGFTQADVGGELLKQWKLPEQIVFAVKYQHRPTASIRFKVDIALIHLADLIASAWILDNSGEAWVPPLDNEAWEELGLDAGIINKLIGDFDHQYRNATDIIMSTHQA